MSPVQQTTAPTDVRVMEPFRRYTGDWGSTTARTDTPDLMGLFAVATGREVSCEEEHAILTHPDVAAGFDAARDSLDAWKQTL